MKRSVASLTAPKNCFENFTVGDRMRHARGTTVSDAESRLLAKRVMNTAENALAELGRGAPKIERRSHRGER